MLLCSNMTIKLKKIIFTAFWIEAPTFSKKGEFFEDFADVSMSSLEFTRNGSECRAKVTLLEL